MLQRECQICNVLMVFFSFFLVVFAAIWPTQLQPPVKEDNKEDKEVVSVVDSDPVQVVPVAQVVPVVQVIIMIIITI